MSFQTFLDTQYPALTRDPDHGRIQFITSAEADLAAAKTGTVLAPLQQYGLLEIEGEEAADFLHKQLTNDVLKLDANQARHAAWCTAKGRMLASVVVYRQQTSCFLVIARELAENTRKRLQMYILRAKAKAHDRSETAVLLGVAGPAAEASLRAAGLVAPDALTHADALPLSTTGEIQVICLNPQRFVLICPEMTAQTLWTTLAKTAQPVGLTAWQWLDVQAGLPVVTGPTVEEFVPQMVDFDRMGGVSFKKGCYPGQEIVARTHYLGKVKRHLYRVTASEALQAGAELFAEGHDGAVGKVVSGVPDGTGGFVGLAVILEGAAASARLGSVAGTSLMTSPVHPPLEEAAS